MSFICTVQFPLNTHVVKGLMQYYTMCLSLFELIKSRNAKSHITDLQIDELMNKLLTNSTKTESFFRS